MRIHKHLIPVIVLAVLFPFCQIIQLSGQVVESETVRFFINNLPDTEPPVIRLISPPIQGGQSFQTGTKDLDLIGEVRDQGEVKFVSVNADVRNINDAGVFSARLNLQPGENRVKLMAADEEGNMAGMQVTIEYIPPEPTLAEKILEGSRYFGLIIGIDDYRDPDLPDLRNPERDAIKLYDLLVGEYAFHKEDMILLKDAKRNEIVEALDYLASVVSPKDNLLIFYAGHGTWDEKANVGYWLPSDAFLNTTANWFRNSTLVDYLKTIDSKHTLLITDACFAGSIFNTRSGFRREDRAFEILYDLPSRKAMTSGTLTEVPDRSAFTQYLIERLSKNGETYLSSEQLFSSFRIAVINNSDAIPQYGEIRNVGDQGGDFIFLKKQQ